MKASELLELKEAIDRAKQKRSVLEGKLSIYTQELVKYGFFTDEEARIGTRKKTKLLKKKEKRYNKLLNKFLKKYSIGGQNEG